MNAIQFVFPTLSIFLYVWNDFMSTWNTIIYAQTEEIFNKAYAYFRVLHMEKKTFEFLTSIVSLSLRMLLITYQLLQ